MEPDVAYCVMGVPGGWRVEGSRKYAVVREENRKKMRVRRGHMVMVWRGVPSQVSKRWLPRRCRWYSLQSDATKGNNAVV